MSAPRHTLRTNLLRLGAFAVALFWADACATPPESTLINGLACDDEGRCAPGYFCDTTKHRCFQGSVAATGGASGVGGSQNGGAPEAGGAENTGGEEASGGGGETGGVVSTGGLASNGGMENTGGATETGGAANTGGATNTGGVVATGGAPTGGAGGELPDASLDAEAPPDLDASSDAEPDTGPPAIYPSCTSGVADGLETDRDCGGPTCTACAASRFCSIADDCASRKCVPHAPARSTCAAATCTDAVKNGTEADVDCGGGTCATCGNGKRCTGNADCASAQCIRNYCVAATCSNTRKDGTETAVDCGGLNCAPCTSFFSACLVASDCASGVCSTQPKVCLNGSCTDKVKNNAETDADCGGGTCGKCADGKACAMPADCASSNCAFYYGRLVCMPALPPP